MALELAIAGVVLLGGVFLLTAFSRRVWENFQKQSFLSVFSTWSLVTAGGSLVIIGTLMYSGLPPAPELTPPLERDGLVFFSIGLALLGWALNWTQNRENTCDSPPSQNIDQSQSRSTEENQTRSQDAGGEGIRTLELLRDWTLNPAPLTWLGNPPRVHICRHTEHYTCSPPLLPAPPRIPPFIHRRPGHILPAPGTRTSGSDPASAARNGPPGTGVENYIVCKIYYIIYKINPGVHCAGGASPVHSGRIAPGMVTTKHLLN